MKDDKEILEKNKEVKVVKKYNKDKKINKEKEIRKETKNTKKSNVKEADKDKNKKSDVNKIKKEVKNDIKKTNNKNVKKKTDNTNLDKIKIKNLCIASAIVLLLVFVSLIVAQFSYNNTLEDVNGYIIGFQDVQLYNENNEITSEVMTYPIIEYKIIGKSYTDTFNLNDKYARSGEMVKVSYVKNSPKHELRYKVDFSVQAIVAFVLSAILLFYARDNIKNVINMKNIKDNMLKNVISLISFIVILATIVINNSFLSVTQTSMIDGVSNNLVILSEVILLAVVNFCSWIFIKKKN